jgi:NAD(P)-dependent dehydrogenase (short-subunit alcohol dehydrogenase family)
VREGPVARDVPFDILVNNAGLAGAHGTTKDGFELTFGTNISVRTCSRGCSYRRSSAPRPPACAASDEVAGQTGLYYDKCRQKVASKLALDDVLARELWDRSAAWVGLPP